jgi:hypothetical protein
MVLSSVGVVTYRMRLHNKALLFFEARLIGIIAPQPGGTMYRYLNL